MTAVVEGVPRSRREARPGPVRAARHRVEHAEMLTRRPSPASPSSASPPPCSPPSTHCGAARRACTPSAWAPSGPAPSTRSRPCCAPACRWPSVPTALSPSTRRGTVRAAAFHRTPEHRVSVRAAFTAHTRGGWRAIGRDDAGVLVPGAPADYAVWRTEELVVQAPDDRVTQLVDRPSFGYSWTARSEPRRRPAGVPAYGRRRADGLCTAGRVISGGGAVLIIRRRPVARPAHPPR